MSDKLPPNTAISIDEDGCPGCDRCHNSRRDSTPIPLPPVVSRPFKSALPGDDMLTGPEMPPFRGYLGRGPEPQQVIHDLRLELRELGQHLKAAHEQVDRLKALLASLRRE